MNTNLFNLPNTPRNHTTTNNSLENNQRSVNDIVYLYRDITHTGCYDWIQQCYK